MSARERSLVRVAPASGVVVLGVERRGAVAAEGELGVGGVLGVVAQGPLEMLATALVAGPLDVTLQLAHASLVFVVHDDVSSVNHTPLKTRAELLLHRRRKI